MKRFGLLVVGILAVSLALNGCVSVSKYTPPPADSEKPVMKTKIGTGQPKIKIGVELLERPDFSRFNASKTPDKEKTGNRGNFAGGVLAPKADEGRGVEAQPRRSFKIWWPAKDKKEPAASGTVEKAQLKQDLPRQKASEIKLVTKYKVKRGQTLGDISALPEVYGTTKKWKKIYEANKDKIENPDKIYAGQVLVIPRD